MADLRRSVRILVLSLALYYINNVFLQLCPMSQEDCLIVILPQTCSDSFQKYLPFYVFNKSIFKNIWVETDKRKCAWKLSLMAPFFQRLKNVYNYNSTWRYRKLILRHIKLYFKSTQSMKKIQKGKGQKIWEWTTQHTSTSQKAVKLHLLLNGQMVGIQREPADNSVTWRSSLNIERYVLS